MKKSLLSLTLLAFCFCAFGQKAKIRNKRVKVEYASLPKHKVEPSTYSVDVSGLGSYSIDESLINLRGWEKVDEADSDVKVKVRVNGFSSGKAIKESKSTTSTDKKTKKKTTTTNYWYERTSTGRASMAIYGPVNAYVPPVKESKRSAKKKSSKSKKKEETKKPNRFLTGVDIKEAPKEDSFESGDAAGSYNLGQSYQYTTGKHRKSSAAYDEYKKEGENFAANAREKFYKTLAGRISYQLNDFYGYNKKQEWVNFKRLKSKKHPEYEVFNEAIDGIAAIFAQKRFNMDNTQFVEALTPIIDYFEEVAKKYSKDDKHHKKIKGAAMYNIAQTYLYIDMPDKALEIAEHYMRWGEEKRFAQQFLDKSAALKHLLEFHGVEGRYYITDENADEIWTEEIGDEPVDEGEEGN